MVKLDVDNKFVNVLNSFQMSPARNLREPERLVVVESIGENLVMNLKVCRFFEAVRWCLGNSI